VKTADNTLFAGATKEDLTACEDRTWPAPTRSSRVRYLPGCETESVITGKIGLAIPIEIAGHTVTGCGGINPTTTPRLGPPGAGRKGDVPVATGSLSAVTPKIGFAIPIEITSQTLIGDGNVYARATAGESNRIP
jgi:hypothetical protein